MKRIGLINILAVAVVAGGAVAVATLIGCERTPAAPEATAASGAQFHAISTAPAAATAAADPPDTRPAIVCFGDSLTAGYGADPGQSYPDYLQKLLTQDGYAYRVVNAGVSGNTTKDGIERVQHIASEHPQIVVLEFGGNDGLRGLPLEATEKNMAAMIDTLRKGGATVALAGITLPPDYGPDYINRFNAMYPALAKQYKLRLLPFLLDGVYGTPGDMQGDGIHATAQGNRRVAANVEKLIRPLLTK